MPGTPLNFRHVGNASASSLSGSRADADERLAGLTSQFQAYASPSATMRRRQPRSTPDIMRPSILPCHELTAEMAEKAQSAVDSGHVAGMVHRAMQLRNRSEEYGTTMYYESALANASLSMAAANPENAIATAITLAIGQVSVLAHFAVKTRSDNVGNLALNAVATEVGRDFADRIAQLPYNREGLAAARKMLYEADPRFHAFSTDPRFNTRQLVNKEIKKGGDAAKINKSEWARATRQV